jgi:polygalacturonase
MQLPSRRNTLAAALGAAAGPAPVIAQSQNAPAGVYDVKQFGATGRKGDKATQALQAAIDAASVAGAGALFSTVAMSRTLR